MLLREIIDCESSYNQTPEGKVNVKTADNALATSGKDITIQGFYIRYVIKNCPKLNSEDKANNKKTTKNIETKTDLKM